MKVREGKDKGRIRQGRGRQGKGREFSQKASHLP